MALSSSEAEYVAACGVVKELKLLVQFLLGLRINHELARLHIDNQSAIDKIQTQSGGASISTYDTTLFESSIAKKLFDLAYIESKDQLADIPIKALPGPRIDYLLEQCSMRSERTQKGSRAASRNLGMMVVLALCITYLPSETRFRRTEPIIFLDSPYQAMKGTNSLQVDVAIVSPCDIDEKNLDQLVFGIESIT